MRLSHIFETNIKESIENWSNTWVHYSDHSMLMIAPKNHSFHSDPSGIYFFPSNFKPRSMWIKRKYKFIVTIKTEARILDCSKMSAKQIDDFVLNVGGEKCFETYTEYTNQYPPKDDNKKRFRMAWEMLRNEFASNAAKWNKQIRNAGWDAIFDDTGSIHSAEVQILILDPRIIASVKMETLKPKSFDAMIIVMNDLVKLCKNYGEVSAEGPKREKDRWSNKSSLVSIVRVEQSKDVYASFKIDPMENGTQIHIGLSYSYPRLNYGVGLMYNTYEGKYEDDGMHRLQKDLDKIFDSE